MKIDVTCALVRDLLPLYADGVLSAESAAAVETHLPACPPCAAELESLRAPVPVKAKKKTARQSLKTTRRRLVAGLAAAALLVSAAVMMFGFKVIESDNSQPIEYYDGLIDTDTLRVYRDDLFPDSGMRGDFLFVGLARAPEFEYYGDGTAYGEDEVTIDGQRACVLFVQFRKDPADMARSAKKAAKYGGRNPMISAYGGIAFDLNPLTEEEKAYRLNNGYHARTERELPITRVYYYSGPTDLFNGNTPGAEPGWSERNGVFEDSVLIWEAGAGQEFHTEYRPQIEGETRPAD
jgi:hypothetical protein